jgi:hypothetical protein
MNPAHNDAAARKEADAQAKAAHLAMMGARSPTKSCLAANDVGATPQTISEVANAVGELRKQLRRLDCLVAKIDAESVAILL